MKKFIAPVLFVVASQLAGFVGSFFTVTNVGSWYQTVNKPSFNPPNWIFGPVWITLYFLMGIAAYLVWKNWSANKDAKTATIFFFVHLVFNALWSFLFFGLQNPKLAFFEIIVLWLMILALIKIYYGINKVAAYLLVPYLLWVSFASILNFYIWRLNI